MAVELVMPRLSESMEEGTVVSWLVPDGAQVQRGDEIAEIETDKATLPYEAPESGVLRILVPEGSTLALGEPIGLIDDLSPLPAGQSVPPPGTAPATAGGGRVPAPRAPEDDPPTASFQLQPDLHEPPHTVHASTPPPRERTTAWSPAWGPQPPAGSTPAAGGAPAEDEGETTEFAAIDVGEEPAAPVAEDRASVLADDGSSGYGPLFGGAPPLSTPAPGGASAPPSTPAPAAEVQPTASQPAVGAQAPAEPTPDHAAAEAVATDAAVEASVAAMPWVDSTLTAKPAEGDRRFTPEELIAPQTLPPRPPGLEPTASAARVKASPVARRLARDLGIDLSTLVGTGPEGRVVRADIEAAQAAGAARPPKQAGAARPAASEFTPPVDEARAAAPIPAVEPSPEPDPAEAAAALVEAAAAAAAELTAAEPEAVGAPLAPPDALPRPDAPADDAPTAASVSAIEADADVVLLDDLSPSPEPAVDPEEPEEPGESSPGEPIASSEAAAAPALEVESDLPADPAPDPSEPARPGAAGPPGVVVPAAAEPTPEPEPIDGDGAPGAASSRSEEADVPDATEPDQTNAAPAAETAETAETAGHESRVLPAAQPGRGKGEPTITELSRQQQTVARRMAESKATIPDFHTVIEVDAAPLVALRAELATTRPDLAAPSLNDLLVKATAIALRAFPALNGAYRDGRLEQYPKVNVGIAVDAGGKLLVPVVHDADTLSVSQIAARTDELVAKARDGSLRPPDIASATFTVSNLGAFGVDRFTAVITPGQAGILTAGAVAERPVVRDGEVVAGRTLFLTLTTDHRAIYGAQAAGFLGRVKQLLERPNSLLA